MAEMDGQSTAGRSDPFYEVIEEVLDSLPDDLRAAMSNVEFLVEDEPPDGKPLLGLYRGIPLPQRNRNYSGVLPDTISIYVGPITRLAGGEADRLRREIRHVVLHEIAHHFGISDERLIEIDRYWRLSRRLRRCLSRHEMGGAADGGDGGPVVGVAPAHGSFSPR